MMIVFDKKSEEILKKALSIIAEEEALELEKKLPSQEELDKITFSPRFKRKMNRIYRYLGIEQIPHPEVEEENTDGCPSERGISMADYKQMYLTLLDATEKAIDMLVSAQRACEELYILSDEEEERAKRAEHIKLRKEQNQV